MARKTVRIGSGSGWSNDRITPAREMVERVGLDYLLFETMSEQTPVMASERRAQDPSFPGYDMFLDKRIDQVLRPCVERGTKIVSNQGWINPRGAQQRYLERAREMGFKGLRVAAVSYNDISGQVLDLGDQLMDSEGPVDLLRDKSIVSVEPYTDAKGIAAALADGADIVVTGKISDPSLAIGPLMHEFGWDWDDMDLVATAGVCGIMLECGASGVCGGFMADPPHLEIPGIVDGLGFPYIEIDDEQQVFITKAEGTGGFVSSLGCRSTIIREILDPSYYEDPNVVFDLTGIEFDDVAPNRVRISGFRGKPKPEKLKVNIAYEAGYLWQDFAYYAGPRCVQRAELNAQIIENQLKKGGFTGEFRYDLIGYNAFHGSATPPGPEPYELALRVAARSNDLEELNWVGNEFDAVGPCGVEGTGKGIVPPSRIRKITSLDSTLVPRDAVTTTVEIEEA